MPGSKTFEMKFQLNASTGGGFIATFSRAQQEMSRMQQQIQRLNSAQGDIAAYQKQQAAIEATARKLEVLRQKHDNIQKEIKETGQYSSQLANKELDVQESITKTEQKLADQTAKLDQMGNALREAGVDTNNLTGESQRLESEMQQLKEAQEQVAEEAEEMGEGMVSAMDAAASALAAAGIVEGLKKIVDAFKECVGAAAEFEATMSTVEALSGASGEEMSALSARAKELGATTKFTATEAGEAMSYMGMAGWSASEMLEGINGTMYLAAASGEDLAMVSDIVTDSMTAFGLSANQAGRYADVLAAAATNSNTNVAMLGETFKYAAPLAGALKYDVEDVAIAAGLMANAGIKGSEAGTTMRNILTRLVKPTKESADAMDALGISLTDGNGRMYSFMEIVEQLRNSFGGLTEEQKAFYAAELAGQRGMSGLLAIVNAAEGDFATLSAAITDSTGAAQRMADIKLDNLAGDITLAKSAADALKVSVGDALIPELRNMVQTGTEALNWLNAFAAEHPEAVQAIAALTVGLAAATAGLVAFSAAAKVVKALELGTLFASGIGPIILLTGAFAGLAAMGIAGADAAKKQRGEYYELTAASQKQYREVYALNAAYQEATATKFQDTEETIVLRAQVDELTEAYEANKQTLSSWQQENADLISSVQELHDSYQESVGGIRDQSSEVQVLSHRLEELAGKSNRSAAEQQQMLSLVDRLNAAVPGLGLSYDQTTGKLNRSSDAINRAAKAQAKLQYEQEKQQHYSDLLVEQLRLEEQVAEAEENLAAAREHLASLDGAMGPGSTQEDRQAYQEAAEAVKVYESELAGLQGSLGSVNAELGNYEAETSKAASDTSTLESATAELESALGTLQTAYSEAYAAAEESLSGQFTLWEKAAEVSATSMSTLQENIQSQIDYWNNYDSNLDVVRQAAQDVGIDLSGIWPHLTDGSAEAVNAVAGIAEAIQSSSADGTQALQDYVTKYDELQTAMGQAADTIAAGSEGVQSALDQVQAALEAGASNLNFAAEFQTAAELTMQGYIAGFGENSGVSAALEGFRAQVSASVSSMDLSGEAQKAGHGTGEGLAQGITTSSGLASTAATKMGDDAIKAVKAALGVASPSTITNQAGVDTVQGFVNGANATAPQGRSAMQNAANGAINAFKAQASSSALFPAGANLIQGAINGINSKKGALIAAARSAGQAAAQAFREANQISSPSKVFHYFGEMDILGVIKGIQDKQSDANKAFAAAGTGHMEAYRDAISEHRADSQTAASVTQAGVTAMAQEFSQAVIFPPQLIETMAAYKQATSKTEAEQLRADQMDRIIAAIRDYRSGDSDSRAAPATIQITIQINGEASPETIDRLEEFIYSPAFEERVNEVTEEIRSDTARRRY